MASRILHLAAAKLILDEHPAADEKRFRLGSILPDAGERVSAHFRVRIDGGAKTMMALGGFRSRFAGRMDDPRILPPPCAGHCVPQGVLSRPWLEGGLAAKGRAALQRLPHPECLGDRKIRPVRRSRRSGGFFRRTALRRLRFSTAAISRRAARGLYDAASAGRLRVFHQSRCGGISGRRRTALPAGDRGAARRENRRGRARMGVGGAAGTKFIHSV